MQLLMTYDHPTDFVRSVLGLYVISHVLHVDITDVKCSTDAGRQGSCT